MSGPESGGMFSFSISGPLAGYYYTCMDFKVSEAFDVLNRMQTVDSIGPILSAGQREASNVSVRMKRGAQELQRRLPSQWQEQLMNLKTYQVYWAPTTATQQMAYTLQALCFVDSATEIGHAEERLSDQEYRALTGMLKDTLVTWLDPFCDNSFTAYRTLLNEGRSTLNQLFGGQPYRHQAKDIVF